MSRVDLTVHHPVAGAVLALLWAAAPAGAAEAGGWRPVYDVVMLWINFGILVFLLVKFLRAPVREFFRRQKAAVAREIEALEEEKARVRRSLADLRQQQESARERFEAIRERIVQEGERRKQEIIEDARAHSQQLIEDSKRKTSFRIQAARQALRRELVDAAVDLAAARLGREVTAADNQRLLDRYFEGMEPP